MKKIVLLLVVLAGLALLAPQNRERVLGWISPLTQFGSQGQAESTLEAIVADIAQAARETGSYPAAGALGVEDPWGSPHYIELYDDSFVVLSPGPDRRLRTDDDLRLAEARVTPEPGVLITDYQPTPPPSSAGRTAKSKALEAAGRQ